MYYQNFSFLTAAWKVMKVKIGGSGFLKFANKILAAVSYVSCQEITEDDIQLESLSKFIISTSNKV
jgi:hypothetical protein